MAIEAPISKFKKNGLLLYMIACLAFSAWFAYDGYMNDEFIEKHTDENGKADSTLAINRKAPAFGVGLAALFGVYFLVVKNKKLVADENELVISPAEKIPYDSITRIDKTYFESKGYFVLTYRDGSAKDAECKISNRRYDNLSAVLDHLVGKMS